LFIESPETEEEFELIGKHFEKPLLANVVHGGGRSPTLPAQRLQELGFAIAIYPSIGFLAMAEALRRGYDAVVEGHPAPDVPLFDFSEFTDLIGFPEVWALEKRYADLP
jgi:2-methylisocitrate lyase-like PEP mutase family enzyme